MGKRVRFDEDARQALWRGIDQLASAVRITLGPRGRSVVLDRAHGLMPAITRDGIAVAQELELPDPFENMGVHMLREVAVRTGQEAGDGTSTATVLAHRIVGDGFAALSAGGNPVALRRGIDAAVAAALAELAAQARPLDGDRDVARVAGLAAGDPELGELREAEAVLRTTERGTRRHRRGARRLGGAAQPFHGDDAAGKRQARERQQFSPRHPQRHTVEPSRDRAHRKAMGLERVQVGAVDRDVAVVDERAHLGPLPPRSVARAEARRGLGEHGLELGRGALALVAELDPDRERRRVSGESRRDQPRIEHRRGGDRHGERRADQVVPHRRPVPLPEALELGLRDRAQVLQDLDQGGGDRARVPVLALERHSEALLGPPHALETLGAALRHQAPTGLHQGGAEPALAPDQLGERLHRPADALERALTNAPRR